MLKESQIQENENGNNEEEGTTCLICDGKTYKVFDEQFKIFYHRCTNCEFIFEGREYCLTDGNEEKKIYDFHNNSLEDEGYCKYLNNFIDGFDSFVKTGKDSLDFGSGPEPCLSTLMKRRGYNTTIYDLHYANDKSYLKKTYDVITSTEVFEHLKNPMEEIKELVSLLKKGGILAVMTSFPKDDKHFLNWWYRRCKTHISFFSLNSFRYVAKKFNLEIVFTNKKNYIFFKKE